MDEILCELCGKKSDIDFNCLVPLKEEYGGTMWIKGNICFNCMSRYSDDFDIAIDLLIKREILKKV